MASITSVSIRLFSNAAPRGDVLPLLAALKRETGVTPSPVTILLSTIVWRQAWKYQDRAFRYCFHDLGHAAAPMVECLEGLGHQPKTYQRFDDLPVSKLLGLDETDEIPCMLIAASTQSPLNLSGIADPGMETGLVYEGQPNALSTDSIEYDSITNVQQATMKSATPPPNLPPPEPLHTGESIPLTHNAEAVDDLWTLARRRRSAVSFDGRTGITLDALGTILYRATESHESDITKFHHSNGGDFLIHLYLYVHRIEGLEPGIYYYNRAAHSLVLHTPGDVRSLAARLSLGQDIAADSAFAVSMIADLPRAAALQGDRGYRAAHIESGIIGQAFYLGAEAIGVRGTGIGAFFDDDVNYFLKLPAGFEVIYHFTVGGAVDDPRLQTCKAYAFEE